MSLNVGDQISRTSSEPPRDGVYEDSDGDIWRYVPEVGWRYWGVADDEDDDWSGGVSAWSGVQAGFASSFPWKAVNPDTPAGRDYVARLMPNPQIQFAPAGTPPSEFIVKDSGQREEYANGFVRDTEDGKPDLTAALTFLYANPSMVDVILRPGFDLLPKTALVRWADHMEKGAQKYGRNNWTQARGPVAIMRFCRSLVRHVAQYISGDRTEDHAAAICFNVWAAEMTPRTEENTTE